MLRCITENNKPLIATTCEEQSTRTLSRTHKLFCPNCGGVVKYNKGKVKSSYFSHVNLECEYVGSEPETQSHLKGKELLYSWLKQNFPDAYIEYEVHIPQTGQIVDVYIEHKTGPHAGRIWAFEFQHSKITATTWKERHDLYESIGIQDFWFFDKKTIMKFSTAKDKSDARKRSDLEKTVFNTTGLVYFLDLETSNLTIDFNFNESPEFKVINGHRRKQVFTYHSPKVHSVKMSEVRARKSRKHDYTVLVSDSLEKSMESRLSTIVQMLDSHERKKRQALYGDRLREKGMYSRITFGDEFADQFKSILMDHNGELTYRDYSYDDDDYWYDEKLADLKEDIINMGIEEFFTKYKPLIDTSIKNVRDYATFRDSDYLELKILTSLAYPSELKQVAFLQEQGYMTLKDYLSSKYEEIIHLVQYTYETHLDVLELLTTKRREFVNEKLSGINSSLKVYTQKPTVLDYAINFRNLNSTEEVENCIEQIKDKIVNFQPSIDLDN